jgi:hypothetical protein
MAMPFGIFDRGRRLVVALPAAAPWTKYPGIWGSGPGAALPAGRLRPEVLTCD